MSVVEDYIRGTALYDQGSYAEAQEALAPIARGRGLLGRFGRYYLGRCLLARAVAAAATGALDDAGAAVRRVAELVGGRADLAGYLAGLYARHVEIAHDGPELDTEDRLRREAIALAREGRTNDALDALRTALDAQPQSAPLHLTAGMVLTWQDRLDEAAEQFHHATQCDCAYTEAYRCLGRCHAAAGRFDVAAGLLRRALSIDPGDLALVHEALAAARAAGVSLTLPVGVGTPREADLDRLAALVEAESDFVEALLALPAGAADGEIFAVLGSVMDVVLAHHAGYADMHYRQALLQRRLGRLDRALAHAERAVAINGGDVQARFLAGSLLVESDPTVAADHLRRAVSAGGQDAPGEMEYPGQIHGNDAPTAEASARPGGERNGGR